MKKPGFAIKNIAAGLAGTARRRLRARLGVSMAMAIAVLLQAAGGAQAAGALAIDHNQGSAYGYSYDWNSNSRARQEALQNCPGNCRVVLTFRNGCGAYAADQSRGSTIYGWGVMQSARGARNRALGECRVRGGQRCQVRVWACESGYR